MKTKRCEYCNNPIPLTLPSGAKKEQSYYSIQKYCCCQCASYARLQMPEMGFRLGQKKHKGKDSNPFPIKLKDLKPFLAEEALQQRVSLHAHILDILRAYKRGREGDIEVKFKNDKILRTQHMAKRFIVEDV